MKFRNVFECSTPPTSAGFDVVYRQILPKRRCFLKFFSAVRTLHSPRGPALSLPPSSLFRASFQTGASQPPRSPLCSLRRGLRALMPRVRSEPLSPLSLMEASWEMRIRMKDTRIALLLVLPVTSICEKCHRYSRPHLSTGHTFSGCLKPWIIANPTLYLLCFR